jgi:hypothetical protein
MKLRIEENNTTLRRRCEIYGPRGFVSNWIACPLALIEELAVTGRIFTFTFRLETTQEHHHRVYTIQPASAHPFTTKHDISSSADVAMRLMPSLLAKKHILPSTQDIVFQIAYPHHTNVHTVRYPLSTHICGPPIVKSTPRTPYFLHSLTSLLYTR